MISYKNISSENNSILIRAQLFEKATIEFFKNKKNLTKKEYIKTISPYRTIFKTGLISHFNFEEIAIFPLLSKKTKVTKEKVNDLITDHSKIINKLCKFETIENHDLSIQILDDLTESLKIHTKKEESFFSSICLSKYDAIRIDKIAKELGYTIP